MYKLSIIEIDENGNEKELVHDDGQYLTRLSVIGEIDDERCVEIVVNDSIKGLSQKIASGNVFSKAARIATVVKSLMNMGMELDIENLEDALSQSLEGGIQ